MVQAFPIVYDEIGGKQHGATTSTTSLADLGAESLSGTNFRFCRLFLSILRRCVGFERTEKTRRDTGDFIDCR